MNDGPDQPRLPLTPGQRGVWFDQLLHPEDPLYNMGGYLRIDGAVDEEAFATALQSLVDRHDALRIILRDDGEVPRQEIVPCLRVAVERRDLSSLADADDVAVRWMRGQIDALFTMFDHPLFQFALIKVAERRYYWFHKYHHLIIDAFGHSLLVGSLARIYTGLVRGRGLPEEQAYPFRDAIEQESEFAASARFDKAAEYWQEKFRQLPEPVIERKHFGDAIRHRRSVLMLPRSLYDRMIAFAAGEGASTFHLIIATLYVYFTRVARRDDLVIGLPTLNRGSAAAKRTVGLFTGIVPSWFRFGRDIAASGLLRAIGRELRQDYRHLRVPIHEINRRTGLHRQGRVQLFDLVLTYQKHGYDVEFDGHPVEQVSLRHGAEQTPLALEISEYSDQLDVRVNIDFSLSAFSDEEAHWFGRRLVHVIEEIIAKPAAKISEVALMPVAERERVLAETTRDRLRFLADRTLPQLFEERVSLAPTAIAVMDEGSSMTYAELNRRANALARRLRAHDVRTGELVALCVDRSCELIVAILGILKAGGAYVPLDPLHPAARQLFILRDSAARLLVTQEGLFGAAGEVTDVTTILLDGSAPPGADENLPGATTPHAPAYAIYTSGSTGRPKGTLVSHHNVVRLFRASASLYGLGPGDTGTLCHSVAFDFSVWEIFGALLHGGALVIVPYWVSRTPDELLRLVSRRQVTVLSQTPSAFAQLIGAEDSLAAPLPLSLRWVVLGGEPLRLHTLGPWLQRHGDRHPTLVNMYGITETTVHVTRRPIVAADLAHGRSMIGRPLDDLRLYVLDERMEPVPYGVAGEIYVGGDGVARGYLNRPALDATRFVPDPFSAEPGGRLYRSGDKARLLVDGDAEYLGRVDDQLKIRGYRVEPGEVRAALERHPYVAQCFVTARSAAGGGARLVAYVVPAARAPLPVSELRTFLHRFLADFMIPDAFVAVESFPLTLNGKIAGDALPPPGDERPSLAPAYVAPRRRQEQTIAAIWKDVLGLQRVGIRDNFFELGGHSLLMVRARSRLQDAFGRALSMAEMFQHPTIESLAALIAHDEGGMPPARPRLAALGESRARQRAARAAARRGLPEANPR